MSGQLLAMIDRREQDTLLVDALLRDPSAAVRARAVLAIGQVQLRARYGTARRLLVDSDTAVASSAAFALGLAKDTASLIGLGRAVAGAADPVAREAAWALGELGEPARGLLAIALGEGVTAPLVSSTASQRNPLVRAELVMATAKLTAFSAAVIAPWLNDAHVDVVRAAAYAIARPRLSAGMRALFPLVRYNDELVRQYVARALVRGSVADSIAERSRATLEILVGDSSARVRMNAARSLATFGPATRPLLLRAMGDRDANVRVAAAENIGSVFLRDAGLWRAAWRADSTFTVRRILLVAARRAGTDALADAEAEWSRGQDWRERSAVVESQLADSRVDRLAVARRFSADADSRVRAAALAGLNQGASSDVDAKAEWVRALRDSSVQVRAIAIAGLVRTASVEQLPAVLDVYARAAADEDLRAAALRFIGSVWSRDSARVDTTLRARLSALSPAAGRADRALVARVTPLTSWRSVRVDGGTRSIDEYSRVAVRWWSPGARRLHAILHTSRGDITVELLGESAPLVVEAFVQLARDGYYRNTWFHRVVPNFVAQDGNQRGDGSGGPGFTVRDAWTRERHDRGAVGLATSGPDTGDAQYYLCHSPQPHLDGHYTVFARVTAGLDVLDQLVQGDRLHSVELLPAAR